MERNSNREHIYNMADLQLGSLLEYENTQKGVNPNAKKQTMQTHNVIFIPNEDISWIEPAKIPEKRYDDLVKKMNNTFHCLTKLTE